MFSLRYIVLKLLITCFYKELIILKVAILSQQFVLLLFLLISQEIFENGIGLICHNLGILLVNGNHGSTKHLQCIG